MGGVTKFIDAALKIETEGLEKTRKNTKIQQNKKSPVNIKFYQGQEYKNIL